MGLDMYARCTKSAELPVIDFETPDDSEELFYWRKHPNLHGWMERLYRQRGGTQMFNCVNLLLTAQDLDQLQADLVEENLPETSGFFFGSSTPEDVEADLEFVAKARKALADGFKVYYSSWW